MFQRMVPILVAILAVAAACGGAASFRVPVPPAGGSAHRAVRRAAQPRQLLTGHLQCRSDLHSRRAEPAGAAIAAGHAAGK